MYIVCIWNQYLIGDKCLHEHLWCTKENIIIYLRNLAVQIKYIQGYWHSKWYNRKLFRVYFGGIIHFIILIQNLECNTCDLIKNISRTLTFSVIFYCIFMKNCVRLRDANIEISKYFREGASRNHFSEYVGPNACCPLSLLTQIIFLFFFG